MAVFYPYNCQRWDYTSSILNYQFKLPLEMEVLIEDNDPVRLLSAFVEGLELTDLYNSYQKIKKIRYHRVRCSRLSFMLP